MLSGAQLNAAKRLLAGGATSQQVAQALGISAKELNTNMYQINPQLPATIDTGDVTTGANPGMLSGLFSGLRGRFGSDKALFGGQIPSLKGLGRDIRATKLVEDGPSIGGLARGGMALYQGANALKGINENITNENDLRSLKDDVAMEVASNPMYDMYLDASDEKLLRQLRNNNLAGGSWSGAASGALQGIPQAALSAIIGGITGGAGGAAIGGLGSLANSAISGYGKGTTETNAKLQGLYDRLRQASEEYRSMRRPRGLNRAGLSTQYYNQLY